MFKPKPKSLRRIILGRIISAVVSVGLLGIYVHNQPIDMTMVEPERGASAHAEMSKEAIALTKAMGKCETLPEGAMPKAVVIDYEDKPIKFSKRFIDVHRGFTYAVSQYMEESPVQYDDIIEGVTLCK